MLWFTTDAAPTIVLKLRRLDPPHGSMVVFADVRMPSGLEIFGCPVHALKSGRCWVNPPDMPELKDGKRVTDREGRVGYGKVVAFGGNHGVRSRWSDSIIGAIKRQYPGFLPSPDNADLAHEAETARLWWESRR